MTSVLATQHSEAIASPPPHAPPFLPFLRISYTRKKKKKKPVDQNTLNIQNFLV
jgi:hypothetical protein